MTHPTDETGKTIEQRLGECLEAMTQIQMQAYPASWTPADKREMAEKHLFAQANPGSNQA